MGEEVKEKKPNSFVLGMRSFGRFLYNPDDHTVFGRGGVSWAKIGLFYFFFYAFLAGFFAIALHVLVLTLDDAEPTVIGRTNKPALGINDTRLYKMDFSSKDKWTAYKTGVKQLKSIYTPNTGNEKAEVFVWDTSTLGICGEDDSKFALKAEGEGCFFISLNRIINWTPDLSEGEDLSFHCEFDIGKTGKGNLDPPFALQMYPAFETQNIQKYYPWKSMDYNGLQPVVAVHVKMDNEAVKSVLKNETETNVKCSPYVRTGSEKTRYPDSAHAMFEIVYKIPE